MQQEKKLHIEKQIANLWIEIRKENNCKFFSFDDFMDSIHLNSAEILLHGQILRNDNSDSSSSSDEDLYDNLEIIDINNGEEDVK